MIVINDLKGFANLKESVVTIGNFDGVHLGHRALILELQKVSKLEKIPSVVVTFKQHPMQILFPKSTVKFINTANEKMEMMENLGVDYFIKLSFSEVRDISADDFLQTILLSQLRMKNIIVGDDFNFGKDRQGNIKLLESVKDRYGFKVTEFLSINKGCEKISSSKIRRLILEGNIEKANSELGYEYFLTGKVLYVDKNILSLEVDTSKLIPKLNKLYEVIIDISNNKLPTTLQIKNVVEKEGDTVIILEFTNPPKGFYEYLKISFVGRDENL